MMDATKYAPGYYPVPAGYDSWVKKDHIEKAPAWCSVDLRDGNQALIVPMSLEEKLEFFQMLVKIGFKEIEVGFPAASDTEYEFLRTLIEKNMIPEDVTVQVLTQCRDHIIRKTFEAVKGAPRAVIHFYNSTSVAQREQVFHKSKEEIKKIATDGAKLVKQLSQEYEGNFLFEYSPESFTGTEVDYAVEVCNAVLDIMAAHPGPPDDHQPARHRGDEHAACLRQPDRVLRQAPEVPRQRHHLHPPPQRPRHRRGLRRAGRAGRCTARGVLPVRQRRAHRQRGRRDAGHEHVQPRRGPQAGLLRHAGHLRHLRAGDPDAHLRAHPLRRSAGVCRLLRQPSGRHRQGHGLPQGARRAPLDLPLSSRSTPTTSAAPTTPTSSASTARAARAASALCWSRTTATTCRPRCARRWATRSRACPTTATRS